MKKDMALMNADCAAARAEVDMMATAISRLQLSVSEARNEQERSRALGSLHSVQAGYRHAKEHLRICNEHREAAREASATEILFRLHAAGIDIGDDGRALIGRSP